MKKGTGLQRSRLAPNVVVRQACTLHDGILLGYVSAPYDGTPEDMVRVAQVVSQRMFAMYPDAGNGNSRMTATDYSGRPRWTISPNFRFVEEIAPGR